jgi:hypothetical protein
MHSFAYVRMCTFVSARGCAYLCTCLLHLVFVDPKTLIFEGDDRMSTVLIFKPQEIMADVFFFPHLGKAELQRFP